MIWNVRRCVALAPVLLALAVTPGCVTKPALSVHHAEFRGLGPMGVGVAIVLQVRNDNAYDVQVRNVHVNLAFGSRGYPLGPIDFAPNQWLPSGQTTFVAVPVTIPWTMIPALVGETTGSFSIPYHVQGAADVTATRAFGIERNNYPIDESGAIPRQMMVDATRNSLPIPLPF
jgi:hypothetical protein